MIKVGHNLNGFEAFKVDSRVFRSKNSKADESTAFQEVIPAGLGSRIAAQTCKKVARTSLFDANDCAQNDSNLYGLHLQEYSDMS